VFSTGGGTGSGIAPILLEMLGNSLPSKHFGCITVLPGSNEPTKAQMNAYKCYQELSNIEDLASVFTLDNDKMDKFAINNQFVALFNRVLDIPNHVNIKGNIDKAELWEMLTTRGNIVVTECRCNNAGGLTSAIIKSWENNIFANMEKDKQIVYLGLSLYGEVNVDDLKKVVGVPFDVYKNYNNDATYTILSGLTFPKTRLKRIIENIDGNKDVVKSSLVNSRVNKIDEVIDWLDELSGEKEGRGIGGMGGTKKVFDIKNLDEILKKY
jgi:hypothetical protein